MADPKSTVFLNDNHVGQTPYFNEEIKEGDYTLKIVPDSTSEPLLTWQGIVKLYPGIMTVVSRNLAASENQMSGYTLSLEPISDKEATKVSVISTPDGVVVNIDGEPKGFTPLSLDDVLEGERQITLSSPGFKEETLTAKVVKGHKLLIDVQLAKQEVLEEADEDEEATPSADKSDDEVDEDEEIDGFLDEDEEASPGAEMARPYVKIKDTPTGWLNVRSEPSTAGKDETVLVKIYPGEVYKFIEVNQTGWYKIEYEKGKQGWIAGQYATLFD